MENTLLFEQLFKRNFSDVNNKNVLERISAEHPYFSPAGFYLLRLTEKGTEGFVKQGAKTALLFNNPHWLNFQLQHTDRHPAFQQEVPPVVEEEMKTLIPDTAPVNTEDDQRDQQANPDHQLQRVPETNDQIFAPDNTDNNDDEALMEKEIEPMKLTMRLPAMNEAPADDTLLFEPMHLVDYFASQNIKLSEEEQVSDKLGKQLRSFTEWLKTMKKLPAFDPGQPGMATGKAGELADLSVQAQAEKSNREEEVITEPMAEVFASQGKMGKAIETYQKLSLMYPSKSATFAAKIEQLKDN